MTFLRFASAVALAITMGGTAAEAVSLAQAAKPAETPPGSYRSDVYVDSRGCVYVRATIGTTVNWVPRLTRDRKEVVCGLTPTASVAGLAQSRPTAPPPPPPPPPLAAPQSTATAAVAPARNPLPTTARTPATTTTTAAVSRTLQVTCPANGAAARVRIGGKTVAIQCSPGQTTAKSYIVRHANGTRTRVIANPPAAAAAPVALAPVRTSATTTTTGRRVGVGDVLSGGRVVIGGRPARSTGGFGATVAAPVLASPTRTLTTRTTRTTTGGDTFGNGFGTGTTAGPMGPVPRVTTYGVTPRAGTAITITPGVATSAQPRSPRVIIPDGYRPAWKDGRLNPNRGPQTVAGDLQMAATVTIDQVPMRTINPAPARGLLVETRPTLATIFSTKTPTVVTTTAAPVARGDGLSRRYVRVGAYNVSSNANAAVAKLQALGLPGRIARTRSGMTVVIAGPYDSVAALNAALATARRGFADAFLSY